MSDVYLGVDIGGTKTAVGLVSTSGEVLTQRRTPTAELRARGFEDALLNLCSDVCRDGESPPLRAVGIACPGPVDRAAGRMRSATTIPELEDFPIVTRMAEAFGCPAWADNDANACALAEAMFGAGRGSRVVAYMTVSTGVGGGVVVDGRVYRGVSGTATEFGHQLLLPEGHPCPCGSSGCLEALASGTAIALRAAEAVAKGAPSVLSGVGDRPLTARDVADAGRRSDPLAVTMWRQTAVYLGMGISNIINLFDPDCVVLGGGVTEAADLFLGDVRDFVRRRTMPNLSRPCEVRLAALGLNVGIVSGAALAMEGEGTAPLP